MDIKEELLQCCVEEIVEKILCGTDYDFDKMINEKAIKALDEIKSIVSDYALSDSEAMEDIIYVLERYNVGCGGKHEF